MKQIELDIKLIEKQINYKFKDKQLLITAFTHTTYAHSFNVKNNQRLEFLGDAVLNLIVAEWLFKNKHEREGKLSTMRSHLVDENSLANIVEQLGIYEHLRVNSGRQDQSLKTLKSVRADLFEAVLGAIYLDSNYKKAKKWAIHKIGLDNQDFALNISSDQDYKTMLQEKLQQQNKRAEYRVIDSKGKPHERLYTIQIFIDDKGGAVATNISKRKAEQEVAKQTLDKGINS